jgi:hypothetical protein
MELKIDTGEDSEPTILGLLFQYRQFFWIQAWAHIECGKEIRIHMMKLKLG